MDNAEKYLNKWNIGRDKYIGILETHSKSRCFEVSTEDDRYILKITPYEYIDSVSKNISVCKNLKHYNVNVIEPLKSINGNDFELSGDSILELYHFYNHPNLLNSEKYLNSLIDQLARFSNIDISQKQYSSIFTSTFKDYLLKLSSGYSVRDELESIITYLESNLIPFIPYIEKSFVHGDLHPHNIFIDDSDRLFLHDFEAAGTGEKLFDLAMLVGCLGITDISYLKSNKLLSFLHQYSEAISVNKLSFETFYELVILIRLRWLMVWFSHKDREMIKVEIDFIEYMLENKQEIFVLWQNSFEVYIPPGRDNWIIADAVFDKSLLDLKNYIDMSRSLSIPEIKDKFSYNDEELAFAMRSLIVAYSKDDDIKSVIKSLDSQHELFILSQFQNEVLSELVISYANASLEFLKCGEHNAISYLIAKLDDLSRLYSNEQIVVVKSYLLRNLSVLFGARGDVDKSFELVNQLCDLHEKNIDHLAITEEYARVLSNAVVTAKTDKMDSVAKEYMDILTNLNNTYPQSSKIKSAYTVACKVTNPSERTK